MKSHKIGAAIAALALAATPAALQGQACVGSHAAHGTGALGVGISFTEGSVGYGLQGGAFTNNSLFFTGGYSRVDYDNSDLGGNELGATIGAELSGDEVSVCPAASFGYMWFSDVPLGADLDGLILGGGLGVGRSFGDDLLFTPHASAAVVHVRASLSQFGASATDSDTGGRFGAGFNVGSDQFFAGPSVTFTTFDGSDPVFTVGAAAVF